jgi:co-chaperonin GroES (HSP10)
MSGQLINETDMKPIDTRILIKVKETDLAKAAREGILFIPKESISQSHNEISEGTLVDMGGNAFHLLDDVERKPEIGNEVYFVKYSGIGKTVDEVEYRIMTDVDVYAIKEKEKKEVEDGR